MLDALRSMCGTPPEHCNDGYDEEFDYIVVGAGAAGCALANRLVELTDKTVLLLENGCALDYGDQATTELPMFIHTYDTKHIGSLISQPEPFVNNKRFEHIWGRAVGGGTAVNTCVYMRGTPGDYDAWGVDGWDWASILPYFKSIERHPFAKTDPLNHGATGPLGVSVDAEHLVGTAYVRAAEREGFEYCADVNGPGGGDGVSVSFNQVNADIRSGRPTRRNDGYTTFIKPLLKRRNLTVHPNSLCRKIILEDDVAVGVEVETSVYRGSKGKVERRVSGTIRQYGAREEVIVCCGALLSPKLLMLSGIGPRVHLEAMGVPCAVDLGGVGENLQDHPAVGLLFKTHQKLPVCPQIIQPATAWHRRSTERKRHSLVSPGREQGASPLSGGMRRDSAHSIASDQSGFGRVDDDYAIHMLDGLAVRNARPFIKEAFRNGQMITKALRYPGAVFTDSRRLIILGVSLLKPRSRGRVRLESKDPRDNPSLRMNYFKDQADIKAMVSACRTARRLGCSTGLRPFVEREVQPGERVDTDEQWEGYIRDSVMQGWHYSGTCRMGPRLGEDTNECENASLPSSFVVDHECRVRGVRGLRVADASVMPEIVGVNTCAASMMIGWKVGYAIAESSPSLVDTANPRDEPTPAATQAPASDGESLPHDSPSSTSRSSQRPVVPAAVPFSLE